MALAAGVGINKNLLALWKNHQAGADRKTIVCLEGSARSGKTYSALIYLINILAQQKLVATVFRHDAARHDAAALTDFKNIMLIQYLRLWVEGRFNSQTKTFTFANGSTLQFAGTNDPAKLHGPARHIALINEVNEVTYEAFRQIRARTSVMLICDLNPSISEHWVYERVLKRDDSLYVHSTYKDNPHLSQHLVHEIESLDPENPENVRQGTSDSYAWSVYGLGLKKKGSEKGVGPLILGKRGRSFDISVSLVLHHHPASTGGKQGWPHSSDPFSIMI